MTIEAGDAFFARVGARGGLGIWAVAVATGELGCDPAARRLLGLAPEGRLSREDLVEAIHAADRPEVELRLAAEAAEGGPFEIRARVGSDEPWHWVELTGAPIGVAVLGDDRPTMLTGTVRDIAARLETEAEVRAQRDALQEQSDRLTLALSAAEMGTWDLDPATGRIRADARMRALVGLSPDEPLDVPMFLGLVDPRDRPRVEAAMTDLLGGAEEGYREEFRISDEGPERWLAGLGRVTLRAPDGRPLRVSGVNWDVTERRRGIEQTRMLADELRHRVRNLFSVVLALVRMSAREEPVHAPALGTLADRITALARAHRATEGGTTAIRLDTVVGDVLAPYADLPEVEVEVAGPPVVISGAQATPLGLVIHELATNAVKYGALSVPGGRLSVTWAGAERAGAETVSLAWTETVPGAHGREDGSARTGFGSRLMAMAEAELSGTIRRDWRAGGLAVTLDFPAQPAA